jgi:hypothetical protein
LRSLLQAIGGEQLAKWFDDQEYLGSCQLIEAAQKIMKLNKVFFTLLFTRKLHVGYNFECIANSVVHI